MLRKAFEGNEKLVLELLTQLAKNSTLIAETMDSDDVQMLQTFHDKMQGLLSQMIETFSHLLDYKTLLKDKANSIKEMNLPLNYAISLLKPSFAPIYQ